MFTISGSGRPTTAGSAPSHPFVGNTIHSSAEERRVWLRRKLDPSASSMSLAEIAELRDLESESDPDLFDAGLFQFAAHQKDRGRLEAAAEVYFALAGFQHTSEYGVRARDQLAILQGKGGFGAHAEALLHRFTAEALEPSSFAGFLIGGLAFRLGRAWALGRLASVSGMGLARNGAAVRALAGLFGFGLEVPAFVLGTRTAAGFLGSREAWNEKGWGRDLASAVLMLGPMKLLSGVGASMASRVWAKNSRAATGFVGASAFAGIFLGHRLEQIAGLKPSQSGATTLLDSLATLVQARVAGGIADRLGGPRLKLWEQAWELRLNRAEQGGLSGGNGEGLLGLKGAALVTGFPAMRPDSGGESAEKLRGISLMAAKGGGGSERKVVGFDRGALAWGGESALHWLLELRKNLEKASAGKKSSPLELWWIPESPIDTVLLNDFGVVYRPQSQSFEQVNVTGNPRLRALWPSLKNGEVFIHTADFSTDLGRILNKWSEREESGLQDLITANWLELQFENLCRKKTGFVERLQESGKDYLLFENGKRQLLPPNLAAYSGLNDPRSRQMKASVRFFQNQFWEHPPSEALEIFGEDLHKRLPRATVISFFMDPRALILPHWAGPQGMGIGTRFFLIQGSQTWMGGFDGAQFRNVTESEPPELVAFLRQISNQKTTAKIPESQASPAPEISGSEKAVTGPEPRTTTRYPTENYPNTVFTSSTVPYPEAFPKESVPSGASSQDPMTTGPTEKITGEKEGSPVPVRIPEREHAVAMRVWPQPSPEQTGNPDRVVVIPPMTPSARRQAALDPTLELSAHQTEQMLEEKPLPFADTVIMDPQQMAEARRGKLEAAKWGPKKFFTSAARDLLQAWRHRALIWADLRVALYRWIGKAPPRLLVEKAESLRQAAKK